MSSQKDGESLVFSEGSGRPLERGEKLYLGLCRPILAEDEMENAKRKLREEPRTHMDRAWESYLLERENDVLKYVTIRVRYINIAESL